MEDAGVEESVVPIMIGGKEVRIPSSPPVFSGNEDGGEEPDLPPHLLRPYRYFFRIGPGFSYVTELLPLLDRIAVDISDWYYLEHLLLALRSTYREWERDELEKTREKAKKESGRKNGKRGATRTGRGRGRGIGHG